jgi:hypothetical protein
VISYRGRSVVSIDPTTRGIAWLFIENGSVMDWGERIACPDDSVGVVVSLIDEYAADVLVLEDASADGCKRRPRIRSVLREIVKHARRHGVRVIAVSRNEVRRVWLARGATNKQKDAAMIAARYPELSSVLPPPRKPGANEDPRVNIFDAASLVLASEADPAELLP